MDASENGLWTSLDIVTEIHPLALVENIMFPIKHGHLVGGLEHFSIFPEYIG